MTKTTEEKLAISLTAETTDLLPYLPYLLQDIWQLGSSPRDMIDLIKQHIAISNSTKILDLGCGKGAVSIQLAKALNVHVTGIDIIPEFINTAQEKAKEWGVENLCEFHVGDIGKQPQTPSYDIIIYGAIGGVLGNPAQTLAFLKTMVKPGGYILLDDGYIDEENAEDVRYEYDYLTYDDWVKEFKNQGFKLITTKGNDENLDNTENNTNIQKRAKELTTKYPDKKALFDSYVKSQMDESLDLETNTVTGVTWLIKKEGV